MLREMIAKGFGVGAVVGCIAAILYGCTFITISVFPSVVFSGQSLDQYSSFIGFGMFFTVLALMPSASIGAITGIVFGLLFQKFRAHKNVYVTVSGALSTLAFIVVIVLNWKNLHLDQIDVFYPPIEDWQVLSYSILVWGYLLPGILYCLISFFVSAYLFDKFKQIELSYQVLSEDNVNSSSA
jgi:hypothetical protein